MTWSIKKLCEVFIKIVFVIFAIVFFIVKEYWASLLCLTLFLISYRLNEMEEFLIGSKGLKATFHKKVEEVSTRAKLVESYINLSKSSGAADISVSELESQISALLTQIAELQQQLIGVKVRNEREKKEVENYREQISVLLAQIAELQRQLGQR